MPDATPPDTGDDTTCLTCRVETGTKRYCAPGRCYCGHEACPAFDTYIDPSTLIPRDVKPAKAGRSSWDNRGEATWIDKM